MSASRARHQPLSARTADLQPEPGPPRLLSMGEARRQLGGTARSRLYALIAERKLKTVKLGRRRFILASSIDDLIRRLTP